MTGGGPFGASPIGARLSDGAEEADASAVDATPLAQGNALVWNYQEDNFTWADAYVVLRDSDKPCIVHGYDCPHANAGFHAGHFRPVGAAPELRYNTWNIHKQCGISNMGSQNKAKWGASTDALYEANLITRIGQEKVDWLKGPHKPLQPSAEYLFRVKSIFRRRIRHVQKLRAKA